jgi:hypothetical protein
MGDGGQHGVSGQVKPLSATCLQAADNLGQGESDPGRDSACDDQVEMGSRLLRVASLEGESVTVEKDHVISRCSAEGVPVDPCPIAKRND